MGLAIKHTRPEKKLSAKFKMGFVFAAISTSMLMTASVHSAKMGYEVSPAERGQEVAFTRKLGNCLACHHIPGGVSGGNIAPPLTREYIRALYPDKAKLRAQIWDPRVKNPDTSMLPFGAHGILTEQQIDDLVEYLYTL